MELPGLELMPTPRKPIEVKRRTGNPGQRKLPPRSSTKALSPVVDVPPVPIHLKKAGRSMWERVWSCEGKSWLAPSVDVFQVEQLCELADEIALYRELVLAEPLLEEPVVSPTGKRVGTRFYRNPAELMHRHARAQYLSILSSLGFSPSDRARLNLAEVKTAGVLQELLDRHRSSRGSRSTEADQGEILDAEIVDLIADDGA